jgi:hypothetical protein
MDGCWPAGIRQISISQQRRVGPTGSFLDVGSANTVRTDKKYKVSFVLSEPYSCTSLAAGSAVRAIERITWLPKRGWGIRKNYVFYSQVEKIC